MTAGVIDQDAAHLLSGDSEEVAAILPLHVPLIGEP